MEICSNDIHFQIELLEHSKKSNRYQITVQIPMYYGWIDSVCYHVENSNEKRSFPLKHLKNENNDCYFQNQIELQTSALYRYYFSYSIHNTIRFVKAKNSQNNHVIEPSEMWKMSVNFSVPDWAKGKIMYHIFVDRFYRGSDEAMPNMLRRHIHSSWEESIFIGPDENNIWNNDFFGGDLIGIIDKLDYIQSLGVSILYLSPIVFSQSNHRYDTADYETVDPYVGCNDDLKRLCDEAHKRDIRVILDAVFNHTGNDSKYFNEYHTFSNVGAYQSLDSEYAPFYKYHMEHGKPVFEYWWGMKNLPVCDGTSQKWQQYITGENGIIDQWFRLGIDGLRLDVADELTDEFIELIRQAVQRNKIDGFIIGEVWKNPMRMNRGYLANGTGMDTVMNYNFMSSFIKYFRYGNVDELSSKIKEIQTEYPCESILSAMNFTSTHDMTRAMNLWDDAIFDSYGEWAWNLLNNDHETCKQYHLSKEQYQSAKNLYMVFVFALSFFPGNLSIFYGDEVGVQGIGNLNNRQPFPWGQEDIDLLTFFKFIGEIRNKEKFLEQANLKIDYLNSKTFAFERRNSNEQAFIVVNRTNEEQDFDIPTEYQEHEKVYSLKKSKMSKLSPYGGIAIKK